MRECLEAGSKSSPESATFRISTTRNASRRSCSTSFGRRCPSHSTQTSCGAACGRDPSRLQLPRNPVAPDTLAPVLEEGLHRRIRHCLELLPKDSAKYPSRNGKV